MSKTKWYAKPIYVLVALALVLSLSLMMAVPAEANPDEWYVDASVSASGDGTSSATAFKTIQEGVNAAGTGHTVNVAAGTYNEEVNVTTSNISLLGEARETTIIDAGGVRWGAIDVRDASHIVISGFTLRNSGTASQDKGINITGSSSQHITVEDCKIYSDDDGIRVHNNRAEGFHTFRNNIISSAWNGIHLEYTSQNTVTQNTISSATGFAGINLGIAGDDNTVQYNEISGCKYGVNLVASQGGPPGNVISNNEITNNERGIWWQGGPSNTVTENNIYDNACNLYAGTSVVAENNWWGNDSPDATKFYGSVDHDPWSTSPNPVVPPPVEVWVDDGRSDTNPGTESEPFATIQKGIDVVADGGTVNVAAGTYNEQVTVDEELRLSGANAGTPGYDMRGAESIIDADDPDEPTWVAGFFVESGDVTIDGFKTIDADEGIHVACNSPTWGDRENVVIKNNYIDTSEGEPKASIAATGIIFYNDANWSHAAYSVDGAVVQDNYIYQAHNKDSIWFQDVTGSVTIKGNKVDAISSGCSGIILGATSALGFYVDLSGTVIEANEVEISGIGIQLKRFTSPTTPVFITGNTLTGGGYGIRLWAGDANTDVVAHFNNLAGNTWGIGSRSGQPWASEVNAVLNWWGSADGPTHADNPAGAGVRVGDNVIYSPWLGIGTDAEPGTVGWQPVSPMLIIVAPAGPEPTGGYLKAAIDAANSATLPGTDTIEVRHGTYDASEPITEGVNLFSVVGSAAHTSLSGTVTVVGLNTSNVTIGDGGKGFSILDGVTVTGNASNVGIHWNDIFGPVNNNGSGTLNASYNYWGSGSGMSGSINTSPILPMPADMSWDHANAIMGSHGVNLLDAVLVLPWVADDYSYSDALQAYLGGGGMAGSIQAIMSALGISRERATEIGAGYNNDLSAILAASGVAWANPAATLESALHAAYPTRYAKPAGGGGFYLGEEQLAGAGGAVVGELAVEGVYQAGEPIDLSFQLFDDQTGEPLVDANVNATICKVLTGEDGEESYEALNYYGLFEYNEVSGMYSHVIDTSGLEPGYYDLWLGFSDGTSERIRVEIVAS